MDCQSFKKQIFNFIEGELDGIELKEFNVHLNECADCRKELLESQNIWHDVGVLETPDDSQFERFKASVAAYQKGTEEGNLLAQEQVPKRMDFIGLSRFWSSPYLQMAAMLVVFLSGMFFMRFMGHSDPARMSGTTGSAELVSLKNEIEDLREVTVLSLLRQSSSTERLKGINLASAKRMGASSSELLDALFQTMQYDSSMSVRIAAIDALSNFADDRRIREKAIQFMQRTDSEIVLLELMKFLALYPDARSIPALEQLRNDTDNQVVREMADWTLFRIRSGKSGSNPGEVRI